jgi:hypothetical protein
VLTAGVVDPTLERPANLDSLQRFAFDGMASGLQQAADKLARGEDPTFSCVSVLVYADDPTTGLDAAAEKAKAQCGREIPIAWAVHELDAAEAKPDGSPAISECASAHVALDTVDRRFTDSRVSDLRLRAARVCP